MKNPAWGGYWEGEDMEFGFTDYMLAKLVFVAVVFFIAGMLGLLE